MEATQLSIFEPNLYTHNRTGDTMMLIKLHGSIGTFKLNKKMHVFGWIYSDIAICSLDNVTRIAEKNEKRAKQ